jgi:hypothetical protein
MSLLTDASLLVTPNAYKETKLYSIIPSNGNGDFNVTRTTTATRVNAAGLIEVMYYNLATYSEMFSDISWNKPSAILTPNTTIAPNGTLTADTLTGTGASTNNRLNQGINTLASTTYTHSIYAKKGTNDFIQLYGSNAVFGLDVWANFDLNNGVLGSVGALTTATITDVGNGWYRCTVTGATTTGGSSSSYILQLIAAANTTRAFSNTLNTSVFIWGAQFVEGALPLNYQKTEGRLNIPRLDYSLGGSCPNILLEPLRTNLCLWSEQINNAAWSGVASVAANAFIAPDGFLSADTLTDSSTTTYQTKLQNFTITANAAYTTSVFIRKTTGALTSYPGIVATLSGGVGGRLVRVIVNTTTGTFNYEVSGSPAINSYSATLTSFNSDYWRLTLTTQDNQSNTSYQLLYYPAISLDGTTVTSTATGSATFWGGQFELGGYATSYIPTTSTTITRNADVLSRNNIYTNGLITASGGTWFIDLRNNRDLVRDVAVNTLFVADTTSGGTNGFMIRNNLAATGTLKITKRIAATETALYTTLAGTVKIAIKWDGSTADVFVNGVKVVSATAFTITNMEFLNATGQDVPKYINDMALFPTPLSDTRCIALTT